MERGLNPVAEGCYTSQIRVKQKHRLLENEIYSGEKMFSAASLLYGKEYPARAVHEAVKDLLLPSSTMPCRAPERSLWRRIPFGFWIMGWRLCPGKK